MDEEMETSGGFGLDFMDAVQIVLRNWKAIGIESDLKLKEVGAFVSSSIYGRFDKLMMMIRGGLVYPDPYLVHQYMPGQQLNAALPDGRRRVGALRQKLRAEPRNPGPGSIADQSPDMVRTRWRCPG